MARSDYDGAQDFYLDREIRRLTTHLTKDIRSKSEKNAVAREYEDHIHDAMQNYTSMKTRLRLFTLRPMMK